MGARIPRQVDDTAWDFVQLLEESHRQALKAIKTMHGDLGHLEVAQDMVHKTLDDLPLKGCEFPRLSAVNPKLNKRNVALLRSQAREILDNVNLARERLRVFAGNVDIHELWSQARMVYNVHPDMASELVEMTSDSFPGQVLTRLPHRCPLVVWPEGLWLENKSAAAHSCYVYGLTTSGDLCDTSAENLAEIGLAWQIGTFNAFASAEQQETTWVRASLPAIGTWTIEEAITSTTRHEQARSSEQIRGWIRPLLEETIPVLLYACTKTPDLVRVQSEKDPRTRTGKKKQKRFPELWQLGYVLGPAMAQSRTIYSGRSVTTVGAGRRIPPGWRRGHLRWQACGPRWSERELTWIAPYSISQDLLAGEATTTTIIPL